MGTQIFLIRHGEATSNVYDANSVDGIDGGHLNETHLARLSRSVLDQMQLSSVSVGVGNDLPDGLTQYGINGGKELARKVSENGKINVDCFVSSGATRAIQSKNIIAEAFRCADQSIYCHAGFQEPTQWPHDRAVTTTPARYFKLAGGKDMPGTLLGEEEVDMTRCVWAGDCTPQLPDHLPDAPTLEAIGNQQKKALEWLWDLVEEKSSQRTETERDQPFTVCVLAHAGVIAALLRTSRRDIPNWGVYHATFESRGSLMEIDAPEARIFGSFYRRSVAAEDPKKEGESQLQVINESVDDTRNIGLGMYCQIIGWKGAGPFRNTFLG